MASPTDQKQRPRANPTHDPSLEEIWCDAFLLMLKPCFEKTLDVIVQVKTLTWHQFEHVAILLAQKGKKNSPRPPAPYSPYMRRTCYLRTVPDFS